MLSLTARKTICTLGEFFLQRKKKTEALIAKKTQNFLYRPELKNKAKEIEHRKIKRKTTEGGSPYKVTRNGGVLEKKTEALIAKKTQNFLYRPELKNKAKEIEHRKIKRKTTEGGSPYKVTRNGGVLESDLFEKSI